MAEAKYKQNKATCVGLGCDKPVFARGMCKTHYSRWRIHGDCEATLVRRLPQCCEVEGCKEKPHTRWKRGKAVCNKHWQNMYRYGSETPPPGVAPDPLPLCSVHKCKNEVRSRNAAYCEKHYGRVRRGAPLESERVCLHSYISRAGYVLLTSSAGHPLADKDGRLAEHRAVAYRKHNGKCPNCFWCGRSLDWKRAVVDHLDENKQNNAEDNLAVSCNQCNRARGAILPFIAGLREDALRVFFERAVAYRETCSQAQRNDAQQI